MKKTRTLLLITGMLSGLIHTNFAQKMPDEYYFSDDKHILYLGKANPTGLYDVNKIPQIRITFPQTNYLTTLSNNYTNKVNLMAKINVDGKDKDSVGVRYKGMTSYLFVQGNKKSFDIDINYLKSKQDIGGYNKLNLNNSYDDASFMREVFYYYNIRRYSMAPKSNFAHLYVNGNNYGLYQNTQQPDKNLLSEWFRSNNGSNWRGDVPSETNGSIGMIQWGDGNSALNYKGDDTTAYKKLYDLKSSDQPEPWKDLPVVCKILNQSTAANLEKDIAPYLDIDKTLWHLAGEILFGDDDSYVFKGKMDYFLYQDAETRRFNTYDYDANSVMLADHATWSPFYNETKVNYPLLNKLLAVPNIRQRYLAHMRTMFNQSFDVTKSNALIDKFKSMIDSIVTADPIKLSTYAQFTSGVTALKTFITNRRTYLLANADFNATPPVITGTAPSVSGTQWKTPSETESVVVTTSATHTSGISGVNLYWGTGIAGVFTKAQMYDDGQHGDGASGDGKYGATIPAQQGNTVVRFYVEAVANNTAKTLAYAPEGAEHDVYVYQVNVTVVANSPLVINEFLASNAAGAKDEAGEFEDWVELHNKSNTEIDLSGYYLTDNSTWLQKWQFPQGVKIAPNGYLIVWADENAKQGNTHANFKLTAAAEQLVLLNKNTQILDSLSFVNQLENISYARIPNGSGNFVFANNVTYASNNDLATSVLDLENNSGFKIMPNPASSSFTLQKSTIEEEQVYIVSAQGSIVYEGKIKSDLKVDISGWSAGVYSIRCGNQVFKIVKL